MDDKRRDWELLRQFTGTNSQAAFAELTRRYLGLVHATALRELGDRTLAEDTTQAVFLILARKARTFRPNIVLAAWLFDTCKLTARNVRKIERRRQARERKIAMELRKEADPHGSNGLRITDPTLNDALSALPRADRQAVLLRFISGCTFEETGIVFGISEDAARKRVERALEKMRHILGKAGLGLSAIAAAELLQAQSAEAASAALETKVANLVFSHSTTALAGVSAHTIAQGALKSMTLMNLKIAAVVTCGVILAGGTAYRAVVVNARQPAPNTLAISPTDFHNGWMHDYDFNFTAKEFNGGKRYSMPQSDLPPEALQLAKDYTTIIYPAIRKFSLSTGKLPSDMGMLPEISIYHGAHPQWTVIASSRLDGTMISRALYVNNPIDAPHDVWSTHPFTMPGKLHARYVVGWDDGRVTFNSMGDFYQAYVHTSYHDGTRAAPPGAAGIPSDARQNKKVFLTADQ